MSDSFRAEEHHSSTVNPTVGTGVGTGAGYTGESFCPIFVLSLQVFAFSLSTRLRNEISWEGGYQQLRAPEGLVLFLLEAPMFTTSWPLFFW